MSDFKIEKPTDLKAEEAVPVLEKDQALEIYNDGFSKEVSTEEMSANAVKANKFVENLLEKNPKSPEFDDELVNVTNLGQKEINKTSTISSRLLDKPMQQGSDKSPQTKVAKDLAELRQQITELDPNRADLTGAKKILKWMPGGNKVDNYFNKYRSAKDHLDAINQSLSSGQDDLMRDNAEIDTYRNAMYKDMEKIGEWRGLLGEIDTVLTEKINDARASGDEELAHALESKALFAVRQRRTDLDTQLAVCVQGYLALDIVRKNNTELIRGVDRAQSTTMAAMQTAIVVAQALGVQEKVLTQINTLNATTGNIIEATSERLRTQGAQIQQQASSSMIEVQKLETSFNNIFAAMDDLDSFRLKANDNFAVTIKSLDAQIRRATPYLERALTDEQKEQITAKVTKQNYLES